MRRLFKIGAERHDTGAVIFSWHPDGNFIASVGSSGKCLTIWYCQLIV